MKTFNKLEDELAIELGYGSAEEYLDEIRGTFYFEQRLIKFYKEIAKRYADECAKEALRLASENAEFIAEHQFYEETIKDSVDNVGNYLVFVDKDSILSENNLPSHS